MHDSPLVVELFGRVDDGEIAHVVSSWCLRVMGSPVRRDLFSVVGVGCLLGIELRDGRRVAVKVVRPDQPLARLRAVQEVQRVLVAGGFPAPMPIAGPARLANGIAFVEELRDVGVAPNGHLPAHRREMAEQLARLVEVCARAAPTTRVGLNLGRPAWADYLSEDLWPRPASPRRHLTATGEGYEVLDELARVSRAVLCAARDTKSIIGHADWEAQNLRFDNDQLAMVYDWDSLVVEREAIIVGLATAVFPARSEPGLGDVPTEAEQDEFLAEYQDFAGRLFSQAERTVAMAAASWVTAYNARIQFEAGRRRSEEGGVSHLDNVAVMLDRLRRSITRS